MKRVFCLLFAVVFMLCACDNGTGDTSEDSFAASEVSTPDGLNLTDISGMDFGLTERDISGDYAADEVRTGAETDSEIRITAAGTYILSGEISKQITVEAGENDKVQLLLDNANINSASGPCIYIKSADKVFITAKEGTSSRISDGSGYTLTDGDTNIDGAVFSRADLTVNGKGSIEILGNTAHAVVSKDDLNVVSVTLDITSKKVGLDGKDCVKLRDANIKINAGSDGIRSDNAEDASRGFVSIERGELNITSGNDAVQAETVLKASGCKLFASCGGGPSNRNYNSEESAKGLKAVKDVLISGGEYEIYSLDDCIHANNSISVTGGSFTLATGDDGMHADEDLSVADGNITVTQSYEGLEATRVYISGGKIELNASDDGINAAGGNDGSQGQNPNFGTVPDGQTPPDMQGGLGNMDSSRPERPSGGGDHGGGAGTQRPGGFGGGKPGMDMFGGGTGEIYISGGYTVVIASGDGIDSNGGITVSGGITLVSGPTNSGNGALDAEDDITVTGGTVVALGSSGMAVGFSSAENQGAIITNLRSQAMGASFALVDEGGKTVASFSTAKAYSNAVITAPGIQSGETYRIVIGGTVDGADAYGYASGATVSGGTSAAEIKMTSNLYGQSGGMGGGMGRPR